jgi:hypothetical protein
VDLQWSGDRGPDLIAEPRHFGPEIAAITGHSYRTINSILETPKPKARACEAISRPCSERLGDVINSQDSERWRVLTRQPRTLPNFSARDNNPHRQERL